MKFCASVVVAAISCIVAIDALAGPYGDDMAKCLVKSASPTDRNSFLKWLFTSIALHPDVQSMVTISAEQRDEMNKNAGALFMRLLTESCRTETQQAIRYEGPATLQYAFQVFGQAAVGDLLANPIVAEGMKGLNKYLDEQKFKAMMSEGAAVK
jgi:hypothetical protein